MILDQETGQVRIQPIGTIFPSPENATLYRPVDPDDPDVRALAESIIEHGVQEPIVVSADGYILSGHRRHVAAEMAGLIEVPCRIHPIRRSDDPDGFLVLLREYNRQRVKSFDEQVREELISANPQEAYKSLLEYRHQQSTVEAAEIDMGVAKRRAEITEAKYPMFNAIVRILNEQREFWPLSERQIHYELLNEPPLRHASKPRSAYANDRKSTHDLSDLLVRARINGSVPYECIDDDTRPITIWDVHPNVASFIRREVDHFLKGYSRDLLCSQPNWIEILVEKKALLPIIRPVAMEYTIPLTAGAGYASVPPRQKMAERFRQSGKAKLIVLLLTDFDPDGHLIATSFARSMRDDFGITEIVPIKVALTDEQITRFQLTAKMRAKHGKSKSSATKRKQFVEAHGDDVYELEALRPADLQTVLREAIESVIDREVLNHEIEMEKQDAAHLEALRRRVQTMLAGIRGGADHE